MRGGSKDANVLELPRILAIEVLREKSLSTGEGCPVAVHPDHVAEIRAGDIEDPLEVHFLGLYDARARMFERPDDAGEHRCGDLERCGVVMWRHPSRLRDRQAGAEPVDA